MNATSSPLRDPTIAEKSLLAILAALSITVFNVIYYTVWAVINAVKIAIRFVRFISAKAARSRRRSFVIKAQIS